MEGDRKTSPSTAAAAAAAAAAMGSKEASIHGVSLTKNKHKTGSQISNAQGVDSVAQGSPTRRQLITNKRDGKPLYSPEPTESPYFGSSVHYGARDFYATSKSLETSKNYKNDEYNGLGNPEFANRGEWWQGSLYY